MPATGGPSDNAPMDRLVDELHSERITLRRWRPTDAAALADAIRISIDHLRPWIPWAAAEPVSVDARRAWIEQVDADWAAGGDVILGIFLGALVVGGTGLHRRGAPDTLDIGYWIHVDHVGRGIAREAATMLTDAAFATPGINAVDVHHDAANLASRGVPAALGYQLIAETVRPVTSPGEIGIDCQWRVERGAWESRRR